MKAASVIDSIFFYDANAVSVAQRYESVSFEEVHGDLIEWLPEPGARVLDVGAGSGRDAAWLANHGYVVTAVEPSKGLRVEGERLHSHPNLNWQDDALPDLPRLVELQTRYDLILLSAVLMFLPPPAQLRSLVTLAQLLLPKGRLALTVRLGPPEPERGLYAADERHLRELIEDVGCFELLNWNETEDTLGRHDVRWVSVVLQRY